MHELLYIFIYSYIYSSSNFSFIYSALFIHSFIYSASNFKFICTALSTSSKKETALSKLQPSLEDSARLHPVFTSLDFETIIYITEQGTSFQSPNLENQVYVLLNLKCSDDDA
jgi:hypothetical protein